MKNTLLHPIILALLAVTGAGAQQPSSAYEFRVVVQPGMTIDGFRFTQDTVIGNVALNDSGQTAFIAKWKDTTGYVRTSVFTPTRYVADEDGGLPGIFIESIPSDGHLAINAAGQVAFEIIYSEADSNSQNWDGIFVDGHLALRRSLDAVGSPYTFTDDGQVISGPQKPGAAPARLAPVPQQGKTSLLDQLHMKPPKNLPFGITFSPKTPSTKEPNPAPERFGPRPPLVIIPSPFGEMRTNRKGQVLIPINFATGGFILVLGTPMADAPHSR